MRLTYRTFVFLAATALSAVGGCSIYRPEVRQGNFWDQAKIDQVKPGMTREQVEFLLGPPMVTDPFHRDRWDYVYSLQSELTGHAAVVRRFVVRFDGDRVREAAIVD